jgi:predicted DsbA family dithiol-disulfide isomerase
VLTVAQAAARKYGMSATETERAERRIQRMAEAEGLPYSIERPTANTFDTHRVLRFADESGQRAALTDRVFRANFSGKINVFDSDTLTALAAETGLDPEEVANVLATDAYAAEVRAESRDAKRRGIDSLPFLIINERDVISGTQPVETYGKALMSAWTPGHR